MSKNVVIVRILYSYSYETPIHYFLWYNSLRIVSNAVGVCVNNVRIHSPRPMSVTDNPSLTKPKCHHLKNPLGILYFRCLPTQKIISVYLFKVISLIISYFIIFFPIDECIIKSCTFSLLCK